MIPASFSSFARSVAGKKFTVCSRSRLKISQTLANRRNAKINFSLCSAGKATPRKLVKIRCLQSVVRCSIQLSYGRREEQLICERRERRSNNPTGNEKFPAAFEVRNELLTQGYGVDRAKSSTLRSIPPASLHHALQAGIDRGGVLRPYVGKQ
jgi:hypothetical protein